MQRTLVPTLMTLAASDIRNGCPDSPFEIHAQTYIEFPFVYASCEMVETEILARIQANQEGTWVDPHNGGHYFVDHNHHMIGRTDLSLRRETGTASIPQGGPFTDLIIFTLSPSPNPTGGPCVVTACSGSQVESVTDFSGGYCNIRNLICGSDVGCATEQYDFGFYEGTIELSPGRGQYPGATADASMCIVPTSTKVEADVSSTCQEEGTEVSSHNEGLSKCCSGKSRTSNRCRNGKCEDHRYCCYYCPGDAEMNSTMV